MKTALKTTIREWNNSERSDDPERIRLMCIPAIVLCAVLLIVLAICAASTWK